MSTETTNFNVQLPSHSYSFRVSVPSSSTVLQLKDTITETCPGRPTRAGQRVIYKGRIIDDASVVSEIWNSSDNEHTIHVSVNPSAWTSQPPKSTPAPSSTPSSAARASPPPSPPSPPPPAQSSSTFHPPEPPFSTAFIHHVHINALRTLCRLPPVPWWGVASDLASARAFSKSTVEATGSSWPAILDAEYPSILSTDGEGVQYSVTFGDSLPYLVLETPGALPTTQQIHALRVLEATLPLLNQTPLAQAQFLQQVTQALQSTAAVTARALAPQTARRANAGRLLAAGGAAVQPLAQIQFRVLVFPLAMLIFRASLLLYIFSPTRRPLFAVLIAAWCLWEIYAAVRVAVVRPDAARAAAPPAGVPGAGANIPQVPAAGLRENAPVAGIQAAIFGPMDQHHDILARLANLDLAYQAAVLEPGAAPAPAPTLAYRAKSFFTLLTLSLHPAWWDRRRRALRNREALLRTTYREERSEEQRPPEAETRDEARPAGAPRPAPAQPPAGWAAAYVERVRNVEWLDE